ncbi:hypothetical protein AArcSl_1648 [Halalkaliarchaeum desulfuricum]|uniref:DUF4389 domain-containing protein n=1 Tax=Halalkaliarchaeum desulfuricum TaxID=2055893 RepID=A0A343TJK5_9EURY|nr:hypothetical protein [Halalkaliarchaeum desulfuricum]AUX09277.1 hypothetical protein AArcSl_1648 [Halalkaliarchaeum desulfuricum]
MGLLEALGRVVLGIVLYLIQLLIAFPLMLLIAAYFVLDVLLVAIGRDGLDSGDFIKEIWLWYVGNAEYVFFGDGSWDWTP